MFLTEILFQYYTPFEKTINIIEGYSQYLQHTSLYKQEKIKFSTKQLLKYKSFKANLQNTNNLIKHNFNILYRHKTTKHP